MIRAKRFHDITGPLAPAAVQVTGSAVERFRRGPSRESIPLVTESVDQPFVRCVHCHADSHKDSPACTVCGMTFDSDEQRRHNADIAPSLLDERRAVQEHRARRNEEMERSRLADLEARQKRAAAREHGESADAQLVEIIRNRKPSVGLLLLRLIPNPYVRLGVLLWLVYMLYQVWANPHTNRYASLVSFMVGLLFMPRFSLKRKSWD